MMASKDPLGAGEMADTPAVDDQNPTAQTPPKNEDSKTAPTTPGDGKTTPSGKGGKLDNLPRENLIQLLKKQMLVAQKTKAKCEELAKKNEELEKKQGASSGLDDDQMKKLEEKCKILESDLADVQEQNEEMLAVYKQNQDAQEQSLQQYESLEAEMNQLKEEKDLINQQLAGANKKNKELCEELDCMKMKDDTLTSSFHFMQEEQTKVLDENKELKKELDVLTQARDDLMSSMKLLKEQLGGSSESAKAQLEQLANEKDECREQNSKFLEKIKELEVTVHNLLEEKDNTQKSENGNSAQLQELKENLKSLEDENKFVKTQLNDLKKKCADANSKNEKLQKEKESLGKDFAMFRKSSASFKEKLQDLNKMLNDMQQERDRIQSERDNLVTETGSLKERLRKKLEEGSGLLEELGAMKQKYKLLTEENGQLKERLNVMVAESDSLHNTLATSEQKLADLMTENSELRLKFQSVDQENGKLNSELALIRSKVDGNDDEFQSQISAIQNENEALLSEVRNLKHQLGEMDVLKTGKENVEKEMEQLKVKLKVKLNDLENSSSSVAESIEADKEQLRSERDALKTQISELEATCSRVTELEVERNELLTDIDGFKNRMSELENVSSKVTDLENEKESLMKDIENYKSKISEFDSDGARESDLASQCGQLVQEVDAAKTRIAELESACASLEDLETERNSLQQEIVNSKSMFSDLESSCDAFKAKITELENANTTLQDLEIERNDLRSELDSAETRISELENTNESVSELKDNQEGLLRELEELQRERDILKEDITTAHYKIRELEVVGETVSELKVSNENFEKELAENKSALTQLDDMKESLESFQAENERLKADIESKKNIIEESCIITNHAGEQSDIIENVLRSLADNNTVVKSLSNGTELGPECSVSIERLLKDRDALLRAEVQRLQSVDLQPVAVERREEGITLNRPTRFIHGDDIMTDVFGHDLQNQLALKLNFLFNDTTGNNHNACVSPETVSLISELVSNNSISGPCQQCGTLYTELHEKIYQLQVELEDMHATVRRAISPVPGTERVESDLVLHVIKVDVGIQHVGENNEVCEESEKTEDKIEPVIVGNLGSSADVQPDHVEGFKIEHMIPVHGDVEEATPAVVARFKMMVEILETKQQESLRHLEASVKEKQCLQEQLMENVQKLSDWEEIMMAQKDDHGNFLAELVKSEERERRLGKEIEDITHSLQDALQERDRLRDDFCKMLDKDGNLLDEINGLKKQLDEIGAEKSRIENDIEEVKVLNSENESEVYKLQHELEQVTKVKEELVEMEQKRKNESAELIEKEAILLKQTSQLRSEVESLMLERENLQKKLETVEKENLSSMQGSTDEAKCLFEKVESLNTECGELRRQVAESVHFEEMEKQLAGERENFGKDLEILKKELVGLEQEKGSYLSEVELLRSSLREVETERENYKSGVESSKLALEDVLGEKKKQDDFMETKMYEVEQLKVEVDELSAEMKDLQGELHDRNKQISDLQDDLERKVTESRSEVTEFEGEMKEMRSEIHQRNEELCGVKNENEDLQRCQLENDSEIAELTSELKSLQEDLHHRNEELADRKVEVDNLLEQLESRHDEVEGLKNRVLELDDAIAHQKMDLELLRADAEKHRTQEEGSLADLGRAKDGEIVNLQKRLEISETEREGLKNEKLLIESELGGVKESLGELEQERDSLNLSLKAMEGQMSGVEGRYQATGQEVSRLSDHVKDLEEELKVSKIETEELRQTLGQTSADIVGLQEKFEGKEKSFEDLKRKAMKMQQICKELKTKEVEWKQREAGFIEQVEELKAGGTELVQMSERMEQLRGDNAKLLEKLHESSTEREHLRQSADSSDGVNSELKERVSSLEEEVSKLQEKIQQLNNEKEVLERSRLAEGEMQSTLATLEIKMHKLETERNELKDQLEQRDQKISNLNIELDNLNEEVVNLRMVNQAAEEQVHVLQTSSAAEQRDFEDRVVELTQEKQHLLEQLDHLRLEVETRKSQEVEVLRKAEESSQCQAVLQEQIDHLTKAGKLQDEKVNKLKIVAVKAKKDAAETKNKLVERNTEIQGLTKDLETFQTENTSLKERLDTILSESQESGSELDHIKAALDKQLDICQRLQSEHTDLQEKYEAEREKSSRVSQENDAAFQELATLKSQLADLQGEKDALDGDVVDVKTELHEMEMEKESQRLQKEQLEKEKQALTTKVQELEEQLDKDAELYREETKKLQTKLDSASTDLQAAKKDAKQSNMMDLEMADYERTIQNLNDQIAAKDKKIADLEKDIARLEEKSKSLQTQLDSAETQRGQAEERGNKLKHLLVKTKKDLAEAKKQETEQLKSDSKMRGQLEGALQQSEDYKLQLSELTSENQRLQGQIRQFKDTNQRSVRTMEVKQQTLQEDLEIARSELGALQAEYDGYKIRVHHVLKQQKSKTGTESPTADSDMKHERNYLEKVVEQLKVKLQETCDQLAASLGENELIQDEHDRLLSRHNKLLSDLQEKENIWREKVDNLTAKSSACSTEHAETIRQLTLQNESLSVTFKEQLGTIQSEHHRVTENLQKQLDKAEDEAFRLQRDLQHQLRRLERDVGTTSPQEFVVRDTRHLEERQQGEGMEHIEPETSVQVYQSPSSTPLVPLEQLLTAPAEDMMSVKSFESVDEEMLKNKLTASEKKLDHLAELLNESEATVLRLTEQAKILKDEIRRMTRNTERETSVSNMEYLKNVVLKFLSLTGGAERQQLVPVLTTMLRLSPDEKAAMVAAAGGDENAPPQVESAGWGSYLHRWSGLT